MPRIRRSVLGLSTWDPILLWYARAVREMQARPIIDPLSWRYQGAVHDFSASAAALGRPGEPMPSPADQARFWRRCQHATWFFLPWHRAYLLFFERTVARTIEQLGGPAGWALPFWNYEDTANPNARRLPPAFQQRTMPDGSVNPLFVARRAPAANRNLRVGTAADASDRRCLSRPRFVNNGPILQFGGGVTGFAHFGNATGACEATPHNTMHNAVGGSTGWMADPATAALDPIFWLHHSNIDRLWELWRRSDPAHTDPATASWLSSVPFSFHDELGAPVTITPSQMTDILDPFLDYDYEGLPARAPRVPVTPAPTGDVEMPEPKQVPEMVGATSRPVSLGAEAAQVAFEIHAPTGPAALESAVAPEIHLVLENVKAEGLPLESYEVYVNVPEGTRPQDRPDLMAGVLAPFGVVGASAPEEEHGGAGLNYSMDITEIAQTLQKEQAWDPANLRVSFVPHRFEGDREDEELPARPLEVGRISLYYA